MAIRFYNTAGGEMQDFVSMVPGKVSMYHCGPTVYGRAHIGNLRTYIYWDILRRLLEFEGYEVNQVMNITDVGHLTDDGDEGEDKMTKALIKENKPLTLETMRELAERNTKVFFEDMQSIGILQPTSLPRASDHIADDIALITLLDNHGFTYQTSDGVYFDSSQDKSYGTKLKGALGVRESSDDQQRIVNTEKKSPRDFALWKKNESLGWESPWGKGFPGWHIECSAMCSAHFGPTLDIHTGGKDHIAVHHTNEIAQSENAFGLPLAHYWLHSNFLTINDEKIAKSAENGITMGDIEEKGYSPKAFRYLMLTAHYRSELSFSWESLESAQTALDRLSDIASEEYNESIPPDKESIDRCVIALSNDLNTPALMSEVWSIARGDLTATVKSSTLVTIDRLLGLDLGARTVLVVPQRIQELLNERNDARSRKDFEHADTLRNHLLELGYEVIDDANGSKVKRVRT